MILQTPAVEDNGFLTSNEDTSTNNARDVALPQPRQVIETDASRNSKATAAMEQARLRNGRLQERQREAAKEAIAGQLESALVIDPPSMTFGPACYQINWTRLSRAFFDNWLSSVT